MRAVSGSSSSNASPIQHDEHASKDAVKAFEKAGMSKEDAKALVAKAEDAGISPKSLQKQLKAGVSVEDLTASVNLMSKAADAGVEPSEINDAIKHGASADEINAALDKRISREKGDDLSSISGDSDSEESDSESIGSPDRKSLRGIGRPDSSPDSSNYSTLNRSSNFNHGSRSSHIR